MIVHPLPPLLKMKKNLTEETPVVEGVQITETGGEVEGVGEIGAKGTNLTPWTQHPILMYQGKNFVLF